MASDGSDSSRASDGFEEEVDSNGSPFRVDSPDPLADGANDITWMPSGDMERAGKVAYAFINIDSPSDNPVPFIRGALFLVAPTVPCSLHPSSRGNMMLRFAPALTATLWWTSTPSFTMGPAFPWSTPRRPPTASALS